MWYEIKDFPKYEITKDGRIRNKETGYEMSMNSLDKDGYVKTALRNNSGRKHFRVHRLVATQFIPNPENKPLVNHKNGKVDDNRVENLEWATHSENVQHGFDKLGRVGHNGGNNKPVKQVCARTGKVLNTFQSLKEAADFLGAPSNSNISHCVNGIYETAYGYKWELVNK